MFASSSAPIVAFQIFTQLVASMNWVWVDGVFRGKKFSWIAIARSTVSKLAKSGFSVSFCVISTIIDDHDGHQGNTALALTQWWHPVASSEALDVLHWAMGPASYCHIPAWQPKPLAICLHFTLSPILFLAKTRAIHCQLCTAKDNVMVKNKPSCHIVYRF